MAASRPPPTAAGRATDAAGRSRGDTWPAESSGRRLGGLGGLTPGPLFRRFFGDLGIFWGNHGKVLSGSISRSVGEPKSKQFHGLMILI